MTIQNYQVSFALSPLALSPTLHAEIRKICYTEYINIKFLHKKNRVLLKMLVKTDFKLRYQDSVLGFAWSMLNPLAMFLVMYIVFDKFFGMGRMAGVEHYPVQLLLGIIMWNFFNESSNLGMMSIVGRGDLLRKISFPKYIIVISGTLSSLINLMLSLCVLGVFVVFNQVPLSWHLIFLPVTVIEMYAFALAISFILGTLFVKFRDIGHIWGVILQGWFYATPIIYPLSMVTSFSPLAAKILLLFPPAQIIQDARAALITPSSDAVPPIPTVWNQISGLQYQIIPFAIILFLSIFAIWYFKKSSRYFAEEI